MIHIPQPRSSVNLHRSQKRIPFVVGPRLQIPTLLVPMQCQSWVSRKWRATLFTFVITVWLNQRRQSWGLRGSRQHRS